MVKAIFTTKLETAYDDDPWDRYHFPKTYLNVAERTVGDWIIYYEPRRITDEMNSRGGRQSYFATARVNRIEKDRTVADHFYAYVDGYMEFAAAIPFREDNQYYESILQRPDGGTSKGAFGRSIRELPDHEFDVILAAGFSNIGLIVTQSEPVYQQKGFSEEQETFARPMIESIVKRPFRDRAFRNNICNIYDSTCAMTGIRIEAPGSKFEVEAAHILPVEKNGPDTVRNGLALTRTLHWMFDRGLVSLEDDGEILLADGRVSPKIKDMLNPTGKLFFPDRTDLRPHPKYTDYHRKNVFVG
jgi:putative restriction endonuclease